MSFKPFEFTFTPPRTVPEPAPAAPPKVATGPTVGGSTSGNQSNAGQIIQALDDLTEMSLYLQTAIVQRTQKIAIEINPAADPSTARSLTAIYGTQTPPSMITVPMYNNLLDAHLGALQLEMAVGNDSSVEANPIQVGDLMQVVRTVDDHLIKSGNYKSWLPLQLASLKGDAVFFQAWKASLASYPAYYASQPLIPDNLTPSTIQAASIDLDFQLYQYERDAVQRFGASYSSVYGALASVSAVERDLNSIMIQYFYQPLQNIIRIVSLFNALKGFAHKTSMTNLQGDLVNYSLVRLASDTTSMMHTCDQLLALAVSPLKNALGSMGRIVAATQKQAAEVGFLAGGGLAGLTKANACAQGNPANGIKGGKPLEVPGLGAVSEGLKQLGEILDWGFRESEKGLAVADKSFRQMIERKIQTQDDRTQIMCSLRALDTLIGVANGVASEFQRGTVTPDSTPQQKQEAANRILTSLQSGTSTTFVAQGDQIIVNPPDMPPATPGVQRILSASKIKTTLGTIQS